jgi:hypothetical protein
MGNMGLSMASNLVKSGFVVKGYDLSEQTLEKAGKMVSRHNKTYLLIFFHFIRVSHQQLQSKMLPLMLTTLFHPYQELKTLNKFFIKMAEFLKMPAKAPVLLIQALFPQSLQKSLAMKRLRKK